MYINQKASIGYKIKPTHSSFAFDIQALLYRALTFQNDYADLFNQMIQQFAVLLAELSLWLPVFLFR